jgi:hypothetical protein
LRESNSKTAIISNATLDVVAKVDLLGNSCGLMCGNFNILK